MSAVTITVDEVSPLMQRLTTAAQAQGLALVGARAAAGLVREHLYGLDAQRHRGGNHFYRQAADSVGTARVPAGAAVTITQQGFAQRLFGGTIRAKPGRALTIPEDDAALGRRAREFNDLDLERVINPRTGALQMALVRRASTAISFTRRKQKDGSIKVTVKPGELQGGEVMYWLAREVTQKPDPTVLPHAEHMSARATDAMQARLLRIGAQRAAGSGEPTP